MSLKKDTKTLKKMLRKPPASNTSAAIFKNAKFFQELLKVTRDTALFVFR